MGYLVGLHVKLVPWYPSESIFFPSVLCLSSYHCLHLLNDISVSVPRTQISIYHLQFGMPSFHTVWLLPFHHDISFNFVYSIYQMPFDFNHILCSSLIHSEIFLSGLRKLILNMFCFKTLCAIQCLTCSIFIFLQKIQYKAMCFKSQSLKLPSAMSHCRCLSKLSTQYELKC